MYFKAPILKNFGRIIIILDTFTWYFILQMITRVLESKEEGKDSKQIKNEKGRLHAQAQCIACHGMCRIQKIGSSLDAMACEF